MDLFSDLVAELDALNGRILWTPGEPSLSMVGPGPTGEEPEWDDEDTIWFDDTALIEHQRDADRWHGRA